MPTQKHTFCRICSPCCPLVATLDDQGEVVSLAPNREHPVSRGFACNKGLAYTEVHHDPDRLNRPLRRAGAGREPGGAFVPVSWDDAFAEIGERLRTIRDRHGPDAIGVYSGNPVAFNSKAHIDSFLLASKIGTSRSFGAGTQDLSNRFVAVEEIFGGWTFPIPDFARTNYLLCVGTNPRVSKWTMVNVSRPLDVLKDIVARGGKVTYLNPRVIESASPATGEVVQLKPDTDVYFLAAMLNEIDRLGGFKDDIVARHGKHLEGLRAFIAGYTPDRVAKVVGVDAETIRTVARDFMNADGASTHNATGVNQTRQGTLVCWLLHMLTFVTGNLGRAGGEFWQKGYCSVPTPTPPAAYLETPFGCIRLAFGALPGNLMADFIELEENPIRALIISSGNPLLSVSGEERLRKAFPKLELIVCIDIVRTTTAEYADFLLPAADWLERDDLNIVGNGGQPDPFVQWTDAVIEVKHDRKDDWWILARLQRELGIPNVLDEGGDPHALNRQMLAHSGLTIEGLRAAPHGSVPLPQTPPEAFFEAVVTPDGKVDCCPPAIAEAFPRCAEIFAELEAEDEDTLKLISLRTMHMQNGSMANAPSMRRGRAAVNPLHIAPADAARRGLAEGDTVRLSSQWGEVVTPITIDATLRPGACALSHGFGQVASPGLSVASVAPGVNTNRLMPTGPGSFEPLSNMSFMTGIPVEVERLDAASPAGDAVREPEIA